MTCDSVYSWCEQPGNRIHTAPCIVARGHWGECEDRYGHTWTRVAEWRRQEKERECPTPA